MLNKFNTIEVSEDGKRVYLDTEDHAEYVESVEVREIVYKNVKVHSNRPLTHEEALRIVEDLYEDSRIVFVGDDDVEDVTFD